MSRDIKFRAWDKSRNEMIEPGVNMVVCSYNGSAWWHYGYDEPKPMDVELMQFTGLHDKNGKEIFEGCRAKVTDGFCTYEGYIKIGEFESSHEGGYSKRRHYGVYLANEDGYQIFCSNNEDICIIDQASIELLED